MKSNFFEIIETLNNLGHDILSIKMGDSFQHYVIKGAFSPSYNSSVESITYSHFNGINITRMIDENSLMLNRGDFKESGRVNGIFDSKTVRTVYFSDKAEWFRFSPN